MLKNSINKCKTKTKIIIKSRASEYESCASKPFDSNNEPFDRVNNTKTWVSMLFDSNSDGDSEYDSRPYVNNTKTWVSMLFGSDSDSEYDSCDSDSDSDSEYDLYDSDSEYDLCDSDSEYDSCDKTDINDKSIK